MEKSIKEPNDFKASIFLVLVVAFIIFIFLKSWGDSTEQYEKPTPTSEVSTTTCIVDINNLKSQLAELKSQLAEQTCIRNGGEFINSTSTRTSGSKGIYWIVYGFPAVCKLKGVFYQQDGIFWKSTDTKYLK